MRRCLPQYVLTGLCVLGLAGCSDEVAGPNRAPVAVAGPDQVGEPGVEVLLDGSGSYDPDGDPITHQWMLLSAPAGSGLAALEQVAARQAVLAFTPDAAGTYVLGLVVSDGRLASARDVAQVRAGGERCEVDEDCPEDGNPCTARRCQAGRCVQEPLQDGTPCDDGLFCTLPDTCLGGVCQLGPRDCGDEDPCTEDVCNEALGQCENPRVSDPPPEGLDHPGTCEDGVDNDCDGLTDGADPDCKVCETDAECDDLEDCTADACLQGRCANSPTNEGGACEDGQYCTVGDTCQAGRCQGGPARDCSALDGECVRGACDEVLAACVEWPREDGTPCGARECQELWWVEGRCQAGACAGTGLVEDCDDANACTLDACEAQAGCSQTPEEDGAPCGEPVCDGLRFSRPSCEAGQCTALDLLEDCDDQNPCTDDQCDAQSGCQRVFNDDGCDDNDLCTELDACALGTCQGVPIDEDNDGYGPLALGCGPDCDDQDEFVNPGMYEGPFGDPKCSDGVDNDCDGLTDDQDPTCRQCIVDADCDDGLYCNGRETCAAGGVCAAGGNPCPQTECNRCQEATDLCFDPYGSPCGDPTTTTCTGPDTCDGAGVCQPNHAGPSTLCRPSVGVCDLAEYCPGDGSDCPANGYRPSSHECRASVGACDLAESCTGSAAACPADGFRPSTFECRASAGDCDLAEYCTGSAAACPPDMFRQSSTECRASAGDCDLAEYCTGSTAACPEDAFRPSTTECRASAGDCDLAENCTGSAADCPANGFRPSTFECRASAGVCDPAENCTGSSADCPANAFRPDTHECRETAGACDLAESCTGSAAACPPDTFRPSSTECRASAGDCDLAEYCTGSAAACPPDMFRQSSTECRASAGACDLVESCTGSAADCPPDAFRPDTFECRASAGACDLAENCTGGSATCPADAFRPGSYVCRVGVGECDMPEVCPGNGVDCPSDVFYPPLTPCGSSADDECTRPDTCDGLGVCQENHADDRTPCRGTMTEDMCDSTCREGECRDGEPAEDLSACLTGGGAAGICCSAVCRAGGECCAAADCDDNNACTTDGCPAYLCTHPCPDPDCMILTAQSPVQQGEDAGLTLEMCPASRDVDDLVCLSNRNLVRLFLYQDFEANLDGFTTAGSVTLQQVAGNWMARICGNNASLTLSLDTTGLSDIAVSSVIVPSDMEDNEMLSLRYSPNGGTTWRALALVGDEGSPLNTLQTPHVILPPDADDNPNVRVQWIVRNANALNDCAYIDEVVVYAMLPMDVVDTPLPTQDFESDFGMFNRADPQGNDVSREYDALSWRVRLDDNEGASLYSVRLDLGAATPYDLLLLTWDWRWVNNSGNDRYVVVEYSLDGAVWAPLVATGHNDAPLLTYWRYRSLLPCPATFEPYVWVRFHAPTSTDCTDIEGVLIDNVRLEVMRPQFLDAFQAFLDLTGGIYQGAMTTGDSPGSADVICRHRCYPWSNWSTVLVQP
jgi:hypothetical protein